MDVTVISSGATLYIYRTRARVQTCRTSRTYELDIPSKGSYLHGHAFSRAGTSMFLWVKGASRDAMYTYKLRSSASLPVCTGVQSFRSEPVSNVNNLPQHCEFKCGLQHYHDNTVDSHLWTSIDANFCIVHEKSAAFIAQTTRGKELWKRQTKRMENVIDAIMPSDNMLLCLIKSFRSTTMALYSVDPGRPHSIKQLKCHITLQEDVSKYAVMAVHKVNDRPELVICCPRNGILRYFQGF